MTKRSLYSFAVGAVVSLAAAAPAAAGGCCPGQAIACACPDMYLVNQGRSPPGAFATQVRDSPPQPLLRLLSLRRLRLQRLSLRLLQ